MWNRLPLRAFVSPSHEKHCTHTKAIESENDFQHFRTSNQSVKPETNGSWGVFERFAGKIRPSSERIGMRTRAGY